MTIEQQIKRLQRHIADIDKQLNTPKGRKNSFSLMAVKGAHLQRIKSLQQLQQQNNKSE